MRARARPPACVHVCVHVCVCACVCVCVCVCITSLYGLPQERASVLKQELKDLNPDLKRLDGIAAYKESV